MLKRAFTVYVGLYWLLQTGGFVQRTDGQSKYISRSATGPTTATVRAQCPRSSMPFDDPHRVVHRTLSPHELAYQESLIQEREAEIRDIESGIHELSEIFRDLGTLVSEQGGMLGTSLICLL